MAEAPDTAMDYHEFESYRRLSFSFSFCQACEITNIASFYTHAKLAVLTSTYYISELTVIT